MGLRDITNELHSTLARQGLRSVIVSGAHVPELRNSIERNRAAGLIHDSVYEQYAVDFETMLSQDLAWADSIIVVAVPQPMLEVVFTVDGRSRSVIIPPTYEHTVDETVIRSMTGVLAPHGYQVRSAMLPQKTLAGHSGLARYGKNNIAYVEGMGSFHRLLAFGSDLPCIDDSWQDLQMMEKCEGCTAGAKRCPTGAIDPDRFQLRAERCLTFHNESTEPFPTWIHESWHHCLVGCMKCQQCCPVNKEVRSWTERFAEFTDEESAQILGGVAASDLPTHVRSVFKNTDLLDESATLARNLISVLKATD